MLWYSSVGPVHNTQNIGLLGGLPSVRGPQTPLPPCLNISQTEVCLRKNTDDSVIKGSISRDIFDLSFVELIFNLKVYLQEVSTTHNDDNGKETKSNFPSCI